jgi:glycosyltransferase involved in cell wall biosynthesis
MIEKIAEVDILMATYNGEKYLDAQIQSILKQTYQHFRILICDDHSKDGTKSLIEKYLKDHPNKIFKIDTPVNLGAKGNFSFLMEHVSANYIMFSDQDDLWIEDKIAKTLNQMKILEKLHGQNLPLLVHSDLKVVDKDCNLIDSSFWKYSNLKVYSYHKTNRFLIQNVVTGCTMMMNRNLCELAHPVPQESFMHDWWIALVASTFGKIGLVNEPTILYRQHGSNTLGAKKFATWNFLRDGFKRFWKNDKNFQDQVAARVNQAKVLLERYQDRLKATDKQLIHDYIMLQTYPWFKKRVVVLRHGFFRSGFLRNFFTFFLKLRP